MNIPENHPALINFSRGEFYFINGVDKLPYEPSPYNSYATQDFFDKWVSLTSKITITLADL